MSRLKRNANTRADINHLSYITFSLELFVEYALTVFEAHIFLNKINELTGVSSGWSERAIIR